MDTGLALPQFDYSVPGEAALAWDTVVAWAVRSEQLGFGSLWLADHLFLSIEKYGGAPGHHFGLEPLTALAALGASTRRVRLGTLVLCAQLRPPTWLAKNLATVDQLVGGRLVVGVGAGWFEPEYEAAGIAFESPGRRLQQMEDTIATLRHVWQDPPASPCKPGPLQQPGPPIWVGGKGDRLLDVVARVADGWNTVWSWTPQAYRQRLEVLERACERAGRDPATVELSLGLTTLVGESETDLRRRFERLAERSPRGLLSGQTLESWRHGRLVGTVGQVREQVAVWASLGVTTVIAGLGAVPFSVTTADDLDLVASALIEEMVG